MDKEAWIVVGSGRSLLDLPSRKSIWSRYITIACNRAIEAVPADYWAWVDRVHYERSKWHPHAASAKQVYPSVSGLELSGQGAFRYEIARRLPCGDSELYLYGGTLTVALHFALRQGAERVIFLACDAWSPGQDRYHLWDGKALSEADLAAHQAHLEATAQGVRDLGLAYPGVQFFDGTSGPRHLNLPRVRLTHRNASKSSRRSHSMAKSRAPRISQDQSISFGYGTLISVTPLGAKEAILWLQDSGGTVRAVRMALDLSRGLSLEMKGQAVIART